MVWYVGPQGGFAPCNSTGSSGCSFTRNVTAVPEPAAWLMILMGLVAPGGRQACSPSQGRKQLRHLANTVRFVNQRLLMRPMLQATQQQPTTRPC